MDDVTKFMGDNWQVIAAAAGALLALAGLIVAKTKTKADDKALGVIAKILGLFGIGKGASK